MLFDVVEAFIFNKQYMLKVFYLTVGQWVKYPACR